MSMMPQNKDPKSTAVAVPNGAPMTLGTDAYRGSLEPQSLNDALALAEMMASIGYCGVTSAPEALGRIMTGRGLGLSAMQSMRGIYSVHGRPGIDAALMHALCLQSKLCEYFDFVSDESDDTKATYVAKRANRPEVKLSFTIEDAIKMGVVDRGDDEKAKKDNNWSKARKAMLRARAKSDLARIVFPDLIFGMYSKEELEAGFDRAESVQQKPDPNELAGEILSKEEAAAEGRVQVVQVAPRDYAKEAAELSEKIRAATTRQARQAVRAEIEKWDGIDPWRKQVIDLYSSTKPTPAAAPAPAPTSAAAPAPMPEGNLFGGTKEGEKP
jgi:hypothetical protein